MKSHIFLIILVTLQSCLGQRVLPQRDYAVDITYQAVRGNDPILHFNIRTFVAHSTYTLIEFNITGFYDGESYSNSGTGSVRTSQFRPEAEHMWHHEFQEEDMHRGDTIFYRLQVKVDGQWYKSVVHQATVGLEAPTSRRHWLSTYSTTTTVPTTTTTTLTPPPTTTTTTAAPTSTPAPANEGPQPIIPRQTLSTTKPTTKKPSASNKRYEGLSKLVRKRRDDSDGEHEDDDSSENWIRDFRDCLTRNGYNYQNCSHLTPSGFSYPPREFTTEPTTVQPAIVPTNQKNGHGTDGVVDTKGGVGPSPGNGDASDSQANSAGSSPLDTTIVIVATVVPAVVMVGLIVIVTIIMKNRKTRTEPDPYQQVFNNMNYNSTMEIGGRPGLPPPRTMLQKPTEETDYSYAETRASPDGDIYEAITHVDYELNGKMIKPRLPSMTSSSKSTITPRAATEWGSDEYEDPTSPSRTSLKVRKNSMSTFGPTASRPNSLVAPNPTYIDIPNNQRNTLATTTVNNTVYNDTYQDPALSHGHTLPANMNQGPEHVYSDTYQDPEQSAPTTPPTATKPQDPPQYEVPNPSNDQQGLSRQYSSLRRDETGVTLY